MFLVNIYVLFPFQLLNPNYIYDGEFCYLVLLVLQSVGSIGHVEHWGITWAVGFLGHGRQYRSHSCEDWWVWEGSQG